MHVCTTVVVRSVVTDPGPSRFLRYQHTEGPHRR